MRSELKESEQTVEREVGESTEHLAPTKMDICRKGTSNLARTHVSNVNEKRHWNLEQVSGRWNTGGDARNGTLLRSASEEPGGCASSPAFDPRPHLCRVAGSAIEEGSAGFGDSVEAALRAFDVQYSRSLTSPADRI